MDTKKPDSILVQWQANQITLAYLQAERTPPLSRKERRAAKKK